ncbi:hypothetical protein [Pelagibacterium sediminicola]|uniref:hypothetical protein n=1 Tax=Pelagibacterium sediminicola TaxID=2248761 RepID=UPI0013008C20|nr:hypothetical protein [Pelagibacterium sediminicola]
MGRIGLWAATGVRRWWDEGAGFAADFVSNRYMRGGVEIAADAAFSLARPSARYARDIAGRWREFGPDEAGRTNKGLLIEPAETYHPVNSALEGAAVDGALPTGWSLSLGADTTLSVVETGTHDGLPLIVLDLVIDNVSGSTSIGRGLKLCSLPGVKDDFWTMGLYAQVLEIHPSDTCTAAQNILQIQERDAGGAFLNNSGGIIDNFDLGTLDERQYITKQMTDPAVAFAEMFYTWNNILAGQRLARRIGLRMPTATKGQTLSSPLATGATATATRSADIATLHLPEGRFDLEFVYEDGSKAVLPDIGGDHILSASSSKAYRMVTAMPAL